jgi:hypothetical protein
LRHIVQDGLNPQRRGHAFHLALQEQIEQSAFGHQRQQAIHQRRAFRQNHGLLAFFGLDAQQANQTLCV